MSDFTYRNTALCGALLCLLAVAIGAFGSHALKDLLIANQREAAFELANRYQFYHGLALLVLAGLFQTTDINRGSNLIAWLMTTGVMIFSGSLYCLAITNLGWLGAVTPIGGTLMILAWGVLIWKIKT